MTDGEVERAFDEVYNKFWINYRNKPIPKESEEWERMHIWGSNLMKQFPFMKLTIANMIAEIDQRLRKRQTGV